MRRIDVHGHIVFTETLDQAGDYGPAYRREDGVWAFGAGSHVAEVPRNADPRDAAVLTNDPHRLRTRLDAAGIDMLGISGSPLLYLYRAPPAIAARFHRLQNDCMARFCSVWPTRFFWCPSVPLQDIGESINELKRCAAMGGRGVNLGTDTAVRALDDPAMWPVYAALVDLNMALFIHPCPGPTATAAHADDRLACLTGLTAQGSDAFAKMVLGGVFDDFPTLRVHITHGGGGAPYHIGRIDRAWRMRHPAVRCRQSPYAYRKNFWFDILVHDAKARRFLVDSWGVDNLVVGSNYASRDRADEFSHLDSLGLDEDRKARIAHRNAEKLFNLPPG